MILDPHHGYIVHESELDTMLSKSAGPPRHCSSRIEYESGPTVPVPKSTFVTYLGDYSFTLASYDFNTKPSSYFSLSRLGLGDFPAKKQPASAMFYVYVVLLAASVSGLCWLFLRGRSRRKKSGRTSESPA